MSTTIKNLIASFLGESQARNRYTFWASIARKEGFEQVAEIFTITAEQEKKHGKTFYEFALKLNKESATPTKIDLHMDMEVHVLMGTTAENLKAAVAGEHEEASLLYPKFADEAEAEGYPEIAAKFRAIALAEEHHQQNYEKLLALVESGTFFKGRGVQTWSCRECGYMVVGEEAPKICPSCDHPQGFFEKLQNEY